MAFFNPQTTTINPVQQRLVNEQRQFQQEIADRALREQEELSLGLPRTPSSTLSSNNLFLSQPNPQIIESSSTRPESFNHFQLTDDYNANPSYTPISHQPQSYSNIRIYRSNNRQKRAIDHPHLSTNDVGSILSSTVRPRSYIGNLLQHPTPRNDIAKIGNWLADRLTEQLKRNIAYLTGSTHKSYRSHMVAPQSFKMKYNDSSEPPTNSVTVKYLETTTHAELPTTSELWNYNQQSSTTGSTGSKEEVINVSYLPEQLLNTYSEQAPKINTLNTPNVPYLFQPNSNLYSDINLKTEPVQYSNHQPIPIINSDTTSKIETHGVPYLIQQIPPTINEYIKPVKIKNVQILPSPIDQNHLTITPYDNNMYSIYKQIYEADHQVLKPVELTTSTTIMPELQSSFKPTTENVEESGSITSLFKSKLKEFKREEPNEFSRYSAFQENNRFLEQLQQANVSTDSLDIGNYSTDVSTLGYDENSARTAIFIKIPDEESTRGYLFNKAINAKRLHKKENSTPKKSNKSAQLIKSSLVYRTPPGKRATLSKQELAKNNEADPALSNFLESEKPVRWLLGDSLQSTTNRPLVSAFWNLIQRASPFT